MKKTLAAREKIIRERAISLVSPILKAEYDEVLILGSNKICVPCVDEEGEEKFIVFTIQVPRKNREGVEYDGYKAAEEYKEDLEAKAQEAKIKEEAKKLEQRKREHKA